MVSLDLFQMGYIPSNTDRSSNTLYDSVLNLLVQFNDFNVTQDWLVEHYVFRNFTSCSKDRKLIRVKQLIKSNHLTDHAIICLTNAEKVSVKKSKLSNFTKDPEELNSISETDAFSSRESTDDESIDNPNIPHAQLNDNTLLHPNYQNSSLLSLNIADFDAHIAFIVKHLSTLWRARQSSQITEGRIWKSKQTEIRIGCVSIPNAKSSLRSYRGIIVCLVEHITLLKTHESNSLSLFSSPQSEKYDHPLLLDQLTSYPQVRQAIAWLELIWQQLKLDGKYCIKGVSNPTTNHEEIRALCQLLHH